MYKIRLFEKKSEDKLIKTLTEILVRFREGESCHKYRNVFCDA